MTNSELIKIGVANGQYPKHLYRFRQLDDKFNGILENSALWFSYPNGFNDPFDCKANFEHDYPQRSIFNWLTNENGIDSQEAMQLCNIDKAQLANIVEKSLNEKISNSAICCFAKEKDDILMWSHYTNGHIGACLVFEIIEDPDFFIFPIPVKYDDIYPKINYIQNSRKSVDDILTTKSTHWKYEKEIRVIKPFANQNKFIFKKQALKEIIFGCKTNPKKIQEIKDLAKKSGFDHLKFSQAFTASDEYKLNFKPV